LWGAGAKPLPGFSRAEPLNGIFKGNALKKYRPDKNIGTVKNQLFFNSTLPYNDKFPPSFLGCLCVVTESE